MKKGVFISLEGPDGSGKSTQLTQMKMLLDKKGYNCVATREPGGTVISEKIRGLVLDKEYSEMDCRTEALLYAAARAQHVAEVIKPALERGDVVICDRFVDSSIVYQGYGRKLSREKVAAINEFAIAGCMPDMTFLFKLDPEIGKSRIEAGTRDRLESELTEFHSEVFRGYEEMEKLYPSRIVGIDAGGSVDEIHSKVAWHLEMLLKEKYDACRY
ncbi:MAG: dTMP kinase [Clostridiales bacterium]|nr:dTMP kinase [Clostridiales bacterium]